jgi:hypothetical protein
MQRRKLVIGTLSSLGAAAMSSWLTTARAQPDAPQDETTLISELPPLPSDLAASAASSPAPYTETALVGTAPPTQAEVRMAYELMVASPFGTQPIDVAQYFLAVGAGAYGATYRVFAREWPVRANPLIFHFFSATLTKPEGDTTAWCAAFVNWCLLRSHATSADEIGRAPGAFSQGGKSFQPENIRNHSTNNASSGSFRCWDENSSPKRGDIVVFRDAGTDAMTRACRGTGHVAFFLNIPAAGKVRVLGGNQVLAGSNGAVTVADMSTRQGSRFMKYVSLK